MNYIHKEFGLTKGEALVAEYLNAIGFFWDFEVPVFLGDHKGRPRIWNPDFYLYDLGLHIEVVGDSGLSDYEWRKEIFKNNKVPIIFVYVWENKNWKDDLLAELKRIHTTRVEKFRWVDKAHARSKENELRM